MCCKNITDKIFTKYTITFYYDKGTFCCRITYKTHVIIVGYSI